MINVAVGVMIGLVMTGMAFMTGYYFAKGYIQIELIPLKKDRERINLQYENALKEAIDAYNNATDQANDIMGDLYNE